VVGGQLSESALFTHFVGGVESGACLVSAPQTKARYCSSGGGGGRGALFQIFESGYLAVYDGMGDEGIGGFVVSCVSWKDSKLNKLIIL
jgi:hypothetical protein